MSTSPISAVPSNEFKTFHKHFQSKSRFTTITGVTGALILALSIIVIVSACLCLTLPNVNVMNSIILRGVIPGSVGVIISIPLFVLAYKYNGEGKEERKKWVNLLKDTISANKLDELGVKPLDEDNIKDKEAFIRKYILAPKKGYNYRKALVDELIAFYPKKEADQSPGQKELIAALNKAVPPIPPTDDDPDPEDLV